MRLTTDDKDPSENPKGAPTLRQIEAASGENEQVYRELFENANDMIYSHDLNGYYTSVNKACARVTGYSAEESLRMNMVDVVVPEHREISKQRLAGKVAEGSPSTYEVEIMSKDGHRVRLEVNSRVTYKDGKAFGVEGVARDITQRARLEEERRIISEVIESVSLTPNLDELLKLIHQALKKVLFAENCFVALYSHKTEFFEMEFFVDQYDQAPPPMKLAKSRTEYVFRTGQPILMTAEVFQRLLEQGELESIGTPPAAWLGIPLLTPSGVIGVLVVQHYTDSQAYSASDLELLMSVGGQIALAIERKRTEDELRQSNNILSAIIEGTGDAIFVKDLESRYLMINPAGASFINRSVEEIVGRTDEELYSVETARQFIAADRQVIDSGKTQILEGTATSDGVACDYLVTKSVYRDSEGTIIGLVGISHDITERKRGEEKLKRQEHQLAEAQRLAHMGSWNWDLPNNVITFSAEHYRIFGLEPGELDLSYAAALTEFVHPEDRELVNATVQDSLKTRDPFDLHYRVTRPDGEVRILHACGKVESDAAGNPVRVFGTAQDVTERKRAEESLQESERRLFQLLEAMPVGVFVIDAAGEAYYSNQVARHILGSGIVPETSVDELATVYQAFVAGTDEVYPSESMPIAQALLGKKTAAHDMEIRRDGTVISLEVLATPIYDVEGIVTYALATFRDVTERKQIETELEKARDVAVESARLKSEFLANMSHEIRTPMNGVIGMTGLLLDSELTADQRDFAETIRSSGDSLLTIINDILDFSKIEAGKLQFETLDFELDQAVESMIEIMAEKAHAKKIELASLVYSNVPTRLRGDPGRLRQVLTNLTGNALKFTEKGEVIVAAAKESESDNDVVIRFTVTDTGIGISEKAQSNLFQAFTQADGSTTRKYGGTGLGLAISKQLVELMRGEIGVNSVLGQGSTFWFTARFEKQASQIPPVRADRVSLENLHVLIVDDNLTNRKILSHQLDSWSMTHKEADSGDLALQLLRSARAQGKPYDLAILDLMMPGMDGFELARKIKSDPNIADVCLVLLTSFGQRGDSTTAREVGLAAYLTKPVRQSQLFNCLAGAINQPIAKERSPQLGSTPDLITRHSLVTKPPSQKLILLAEDNIVNQKVAVRQLQKLGYRADAVANGREAVEALERISYDLVLMDCQMPELDGYEATGEIRRREGNTKHTPIVAMTANALQGDRDRCLAAGMDDYISKPVKPEDLAQVLGRLLAKTSNEEEVESKITEPVSPPVDMKRLYQVMGTEPTELREILDIYLEQMPLSLEKLSIAIESGNANDVNLIAHNCAGTSANCGITAVVEAFKELERMGREQQLSGAGPLRDQVCADFERVKLFLEEQLQTVTV
jgi:two-component system sensor histidine kinase/response regulator